MLTWLQMNGPEPVHIFLHCVPHSVLPLHVSWCLHIELEWMDLPLVLGMVHTLLFLLLRFSVVAFRFCLLTPSCWLCCLLAASCFCPAEICWLVALLKTQRSTGTGSYSKTRHTNAYSAQIQRPQSDDVGQRYIQTHIEQCCKCTTLGQNDGDKRERSYNM